ncbi:hypothetical protein OG984_06480 [Nocardioides sp. NBC_00368]|uniref:hypothetical protein n=1 Tax=Nocardioides sp. NBC_00368 TaxID=2976000 RepID=UPI002E1CD8E3
MKQFQNDMKKSQSVLSKFGKVAAAGFGVAGIAAVSMFDDFIASSREAARASRVIDSTWGNLADDVKKSFGSLSETYAISERDLSSLASTMGRAGVTSQAELEKIADSMQRTGLSADALSSAFMAEYDVLDNFGINLKQSQVDLEAARLAQEEYGKSLEALTVSQQNAMQSQAILNLVNEQAGRIKPPEAGSWEDSTSRIAESFTDIGRTLGSFGIKYLTPWAEAFADALDDVEVDLKEFAKTTDATALGAEHLEALKTVVEDTDWKGLSALSAGLLAGGASAHVLAAGIAASATASSALVTNLRDVAKERKKALGVNAEKREGLSAEIEENKELLALLADDLMDFERARKERGGLSSASEVAAMAQFDEVTEKNRKLKESFADLSIENQKLSGSFGFLRALLNPVGLTIGAITLAVAALVGGLTYLYTKFESVKMAADSAWFMEMVPAINRLKTAWDEVVTSLDNALAPFGGLEGTARSFGETVLPFLIGRLADTVNQLAAFLRGVAMVIDGIAAFASWCKRAYNAIRDWGNETQRKVDAMDAAIDGFISDAVRYIKSLPGKIAGVAGDMAAKFTDFDWSGLGSDIVAGIASGITGAGSSVVTSLVDVASDGLAAAKAALGIHSPSRVFMREVGVWIPRGIAKGIRSKNSEVEKEIVRGLRKAVAAARKEWDEARSSITSSGNSAESSFTTAILGERYSGARKNVEDLIGSMSTGLRTALQGIPRAGKIFDRIWKSTDKQRARLRDLGNRINSNNAALEKARDLQSKINSLSDSISQKWTGFADINASDNWKTVSRHMQDDLRTFDFSGWMNDLTSSASQAVAAANLGKQVLDKYDLSNAAAEAIAGLDAESQAAVYEGLLKGGQAAVAQLNSAYSQLGSSGEAFGDALSKELYGKTDSQAAAYVAGLTKRQKELNAAAVKMADAFNARIQGAVAKAEKASNTKVSVKLSAQQVSAIQRGREITLDIQAYEKSKGKKR